MISETPSILQEGTWKSDTYPMVRKQTEPDFAANCPVQQVLEIIADKWSVIILCALSYGTKRYNELQRQIGGISQKMLTQTLRKLERNGLVERRVYAVVPPKVEYSLTPLSETLTDSMEVLCQWAEKNFAEIEAARQRYEA